MQIRPAKAVCSSTQPGGAGQVRAPVHANVGYMGARELGLGCCLWMRKDLVGLCRGACALSLSGWSWAKDAACIVAGVMQACITDALATPLARSLILLRMEPGIQSSVCRPWLYTLGAVLGGLANRACKSGR
jgi:hypothetical protein